MERIHGEAGTSARDGDVDGRMHLRSGPAGSDHGDAKSRIGAIRDDAFDRLEDVRDRAIDFADRTKDRISGSVERVSDTLYGDEGLVPTIRRRPLISVGVAFSTGFVIAALTGSRHRNWFAERARRQLRGMILSGLAATLTHELRSIVGAEDGFGDLVESFLGEGPEDEEEYDDF